jgi:hypothetical protein
VGVVDIAVVVLVLVVRKKEGDCDALLLLLLLLIQDNASRIRPFADRHRRHHRRNLLPRRRDADMVAVAADSWKATWSKPTFCVNLVVNVLK